ncbi:MAG: ABC transporter ATP-binding protein [Methanoregulaceae archaeon]|nr:ABC transporter ATP-binding protein [Methanoregulaceae archaeon]
MITASGLTKTYGLYKALDHVSFGCGDGEIFGVIGHNGAGKTTMLKILSGLIDPTEGRLEIGGIDVLSDPDHLKRILGYLPEESRLYETMTVDEYLRFFGEIYALDRQTIERRKRELLESLSLDPDGKKMGEFSKGMKRKVAIARSLIHNPSVLIYDEPTSGLDPMTSRYIIDYLKDLRNEGKTIVLSAHNLYQVEEICNKVMILRRGKVVAMGNMHELREMFGSISYRISFHMPDISHLESCREYSFEGGLYHVSVPDIGEMNRCTEVIGRHGGRVERIESHYPTLEEMLIRIGK